MKKIIAEFKEFISRGNVMDLAVGMIMGTATTGIVKSLVDDVIMPIAGILLGGVDFTTLVINIPSFINDSVVHINVGMFIQNIINFLIIALCVFMMVKFLNIFKRKQDEEEVDVVNELSLLEKNLECLQDIKTLLEKQEKNSNQ